MSPVPDIDYATEFSVEVKVRSGRLIKERYTDKTRLENDLSSLDERVVSEVTIYWTNDDGVFCYVKIPWTAFKTI